MRIIRPPAVAGLFYPGDPDELRHVLEDLLAGPPPGPAPKAAIAPHAGYVYSGHVAADVYRRVAQARGRVERVVLELHARVCERGKDRLELLVGWTNAVHTERRVMCRRFDLTDITKLRDVWLGLGMIW